MQLHCDIQGSGEPLVMLHGLFGSNSNLGLLARSLESGFRLLRADLRNHGLSPHAPTMSFSEMAEDVRELLDAQGIEQAHLFGHSLGGKTCMEFALRYPARVKKLVVADIAPRKYPRHHEDILEALLSVDLKNISSRSDADKQVAKFISEVGVRQFLLKNLVRDEESGYQWLLNLSAIANSYDDIRAGLGEGKRYDGEALFIRGGNSNYIRDQDISGIKKIFSNAKVETVAGASHWLHAEKPKVFAQLVKAFLENTQ